VMDESAGEDLRQPRNGLGRGSFVSGQCSLRPPESGTQDEASGTCRLQELAPRPELFPEVRMADVARRAGCRPESRLVRLVAHRPLLLSDSGLRILERHTPGAQTERQEKLGVRLLSLRRYSASYGDCRGWRPTAGRKAHRHRAALLRRNRNVSRMANDLFCAGYPFFSRCQIFFRIFSLCFFMCAPSPAGSYLTRRKGRSNAR
jgi:hypothetical protein